MNIRLFGCLLLMSALWGSAFAGIAKGLESFGFGELALLRFGTASLCFIPIYFFVRRRAKLRPRDVPAFFGLGLLGVTIYHLALNFGEARGVPAGTSSVLVATIPVMNAIAAHFFLADRLSVRGWLGIAVCFCGVGLTALHGRDDRLVFDWNAGWVLLAALCGTFYTVLQKPLFKKYSGLEVAAYATWFGSIPMLFWLPGLLKQFPEASVEAIAAGVYIGVFPAAAAYALYSYALSKIPVTRVSVYYYLIPVFGFFFAWWWKHETPTLGALFGATLTLFGILIVERAGRAQRARETSTPEAPSRSAAESVS